MVKIVKSTRAFEEDYEELIEDAREIHRRTGCVINVQAVHPITGESYEVVVDSDGDDYVPAKDPFTAHVVRRYLRLKGRLGEVTLRMLSEELGSDMRLDEVKKLMLRVRGIRLAALRRSKAARVVSVAELLPEVARLGTFFRPPVAVMAPPDQEGIKLASHLVTLGSSMVKRREVKTFTLAMFDV